MKLFTEIHKSMEMPIAMTMQKECDKGFVHLHVSQFGKIQMKVNAVPRKTSRDTLLSAVFNSVMKGWNDEPRLLEV